MKPYSLDLRKRIVAAVAQGKSCGEVARLFHVSSSTVKRYVKQWREQGNMLPRPIPGRPSKKLAPLQAGLQAQLEAFPDATLEERCEQWEAQEGTKVSIATMSRAINRLMNKEKKRYLNYNKKKRYGGENKKKRKKRVHDEKESSTTDP